MSTLASDGAALAFVMRCITETPDLYVRGSDAVALGTRLREDLGIDSIGLVSLFYSVTDALGVEADEDETARLVTIGDVISLARRLEHEANG
jgi:acyl carrier protein